MKNGTSKIAELRKAAKLTQAKLGEILGISVFTIGKWEYQHNPPEYIVKLIEYYLVNEGYIKKEEQTDENT